MAVGHSIPVEQWSIACVVESMLSGMLGVGNYCEGSRPDLAGVILARVHACVHLGIARRTRTHTDLRPAVICHCTARFFEQQMGLWPQPLSRPCQGAAVAAAATVLTTADAQARGTHAAES